VTLRSQRLLVLSLAIGTVACGLSFLACTKQDDPGTDTHTGSGSDASGSDASGGQSSDDGGFDAGLPPKNAAVCFDGAAVSSGGFESSYVMLSSGSYEQDEAFYLLTILDSEPSLLAALAKDPILGPIASSHDMKARNATSSCGSNVACYATALEWTTADIQAVASELPTALASELPALAASHLRPSGMFALYAGGSDAELLSRALEQHGGHAERDVRWLCGNPRWGLA
jgi:hypothetical protein